MRTLKLRRMLAGLALTLLLAVGAFALWPRTAAAPGITKENFDRIKAGTSRTEVEAILRGPPRNCTTKRTAFELLPTALDVFAPSPGPPSVWEGDGGMIQVFFDDSGRATAKTFHGIRQADVTVLID